MDDEKIYEFLEVIYLYFGIFSFGMGIAVKLFTENNDIAMVSLLLLGLIAMTVSNTAMNSKRIERLKKTIGEEK